MLNSLNSFFSPKSLALVGASAHQHKLGHAVLQNIRSSGYQGAIYPINPNTSQILDYVAYPSLEVLPEIPELVIIVIPAEHVLAVVENCGKIGCKNIVIISAGFKEIGAEGIEREKKLQTLSKRYGLTILGPNCLGFINTACPLDASFAQRFPEQGGLAFISQSGAMGTAMLDLAAAEGIGFSLLVSVGNKAGLEETALLEHLRQDPQTQVIVSYVENIEAGREFMHVASKVTKHKPVIMLKSGKTAKGQAAVSSHTGALAGSNTAYEAAFIQSGVLEVQGVQTLFNLAKACALQPIPTGNRVAIITNAGGPGVLTTDLLIKQGLNLATLSPQTEQSLRSGLPTAAAIHNPIDILGDAPAERYAHALRCLVDDSNVDALLVLLTPQAATEIGETIKILGSATKETEKPVLACFMGGESITTHAGLFVEYGIPRYTYPEEAVTVLAAMVRYGTWKEQKNRTLPSSDEPRENSSLPEKKTPLTEKNSEIKQILDTAKQAGKTVLVERVCREILTLASIPMNTMHVLRGPENVPNLEKDAYPIVLKVISEQVLHKSDAGGVHLGITSPDTLTQAITTMEQSVHAKVPGAQIEGYLAGTMVEGGQEVIIGMKRDPQFGPLLMVGLGGIYAEVFQDVAFRVAPLSHEEALAMIGEIRSVQLLRGTRGERPSDITALANLLVQLGDFALQFPEISEFDCNPVKVFAQGEGVMVLDIRILLG